MDKDIKNNIEQFIKDITAQIIEYKNINKIKVIPIYKHKRIIMDFYYDIDNFSLYNTVQIQPFTKIEYWLNNKSNFIDELELKSKSFKKLIKIDNKFRALVFEFVIHFYNSFLENNLKINNLNELIEGFYTYIKNHKFEETLEVKISGVFLEEDEYKINDNLSIKRPVKEDLELEIYFDPHKSCNTSEFFFSAIITYKKNYDINRKPTENTDKVKNLQSSLRLLSLCDAKIGKAKTSSNIYTGDHFWFVYDYQENHNKPRYNTVLKENDAFYWNKIFEKLGKEENINKTYLCIALDLYNNALDWFKDPLFSSNNYFYMEFGNKITSLVCALEALYSNNNMELTRQLSQRVSFIFRLFNYDSLNVKNGIKQAYDIRSTYSHGDEIKFSSDGKSVLKYKSIKPIEDKQVFLQQLLEYVRKSILLFLFINTDKDSFLTLIDDALLDAAKFNDLKQLLSDLEIISILQT